VLQSYSVSCIPQWSFTLMPPDFGTQDILGLGV
jgi:hypothetical protein